MSNKSSSIFVAVQVPEGGEAWGEDFCGVKQAGAESTLAGYAGQGNHLNCSLNERARNFQLLNIKRPTLTYHENAFKSILSVVMV